MFGINRLLAPRWLQHLERLRSALESWRERVRAALAEVVSEAATKAVREAVQTLANTSEPDPLPHSWSSSQEQYGRSWGEPARSSWSSYGSTWEPEEQEYADVEDEIEDQPAVVAVSPPPVPELSPPAHRSRALALGLQAAAWWLRRRAVQFPVRSALGLGAAATLVAYLAGPAVALSGVGLAGAVLTCWL